MSAENTVNLEGDNSNGQRIFQAVAALCIVVFGGTLGFMQIQDWDFWRALFFVLITVTTVGYSADGLTPAGEVFTAVLLVGGIGTATYAFGVIVRASVGAQLSWRQNMHKQIKKMSGHYIVCGFGRIGRTVCGRLAAAGYQVVVIEGVNDAVQEARERGFPALRGNATEDEVLQQAGIMRARGVVCAVNSDSDNIVITLGAREMRPDITIIARVDEDGATRKISRAGATKVVSPFRTGAIDIANAIIRPNVSEFLQGSSQEPSDLELSEIAVEQGSLLAGRCLGDFTHSGSAGVVFVAIKRSDGSKLVGPSVTARLNAGDVVIVAGDPRGLAAVRERAGQGQMAS